MHYLDANIWHQHVSLNYKVADIRWSLLKHVLTFQYCLIPVARNTVVLFVTESVESLDQLC